MDFHSLKPDVNQAKEQWVSIARQDKVQTLLNSHGMDWLRPFHSRVGILGFCLLFGRLEFIFLSLNFRPLLEDWVINPFFHWQESSDFGL